MIDQTITLKDIAQLIQGILDTTLDKKLAAFEVKMEAMIDAKIDKASREQAEALADFAAMVNERFDKIEARLDRVEATLDMSVERIDQHDAILGYNIQLTKLKALPTS